VSLIAGISLVLKNLEADEDENEEEEESQVS